MAMRETVRSLRIYFILSGLLSGGMNLTSLLQGASGAVAAFALVGVGFAVAYLYVGIALPQLLTKAPARVTNVLIAGAVFLALLFLLDLLSGMTGRTLPMVLVGLLITWYLFVNVRRLAAESQRAPASTAAGA